MLKIVYPICCGIDVHKTFVIACIASTNEVGITKYQSKRFSTFTKGLHDLMRYRFKLTNFGSSEKNRFQNCLTVSNIQLASVVTDTFGKSSMNIIEHILENPLDKNIDIASLIYGSLAKKIPELELAIDGVITETQAEKLKS